MSNATRKLLGTTPAAGGQIDISDYFSTYLYAGNGSTQTITNGIDLAGEGGLVWIKDRTAANSHHLFDSERGVTYSISSNSTSAQFYNSGFSSNSFNLNGFSIGTYPQINTSGNKYASWTFRKAPRFFDVVTYTGTGVARSINHNLGIAPGFIATFELTGAGGPHRCWHTSLGPTGYMPGLEQTAAAASSNAVFNGVSDTTFTIGGSASINESGINYVAYLFAHDPLGPSGDGSDGLIACGSYTGNGSTTGPEINLGWEPQWLLLKNASGAYNWSLVDNMRDFRTPTINVGLFDLAPNLSDAESEGRAFGATSTGFKVVDDHPEVNASGNTYIYIAIRRGPMRQPTSGTEVFAVDTQGSTLPRPPAFKAGFPVDFAIRTSTGSAFNHANTRILGDKYMATNATSAEATQAAVKFDYQDGYFNSTGISSTTLAWMFRRAPGFFDVVAYEGVGTAQDISHNLTVAPEFMIIKNRDVAAATGWATWHKDLSGDTYYLRLQSTLSEADGFGLYFPTAPSATTFRVGTNGAVNGAGESHIAFLFATLPGVSKVGSYTGNGSSQTIDCGFTSGARFVLIKSTTQVADWNVYDTARGIVAGNDAELSLNSTAAENTNTDYIDPHSSGFIIPTSTQNSVGHTYIFLAIA